MTIPGNRLASSPGLFFSLNVMKEMNGRTDKASNRQALHDNIVYVYVDCLIRYVQAVILNRTHTHTHTLLAGCLMP